MKRQEEKKKEEEEKKNCNEAKNQRLKYFDKSQTLNQIYREAKRINKSRVQYTQLEHYYAAIDDNANSSKHLFLYEVYLNSLTSTCQVCAKGMSSIVAISPTRTLSSIHIT
uniref:Uncharacterized protein n=1 Tax=Glossina austeni TaxID=7395 RepID=A0A1A9VED6_GLOAU